MFDIGILEILVIAVVALLIVGPEEFPYLLRSVGRTFGKVRRMISSVRDQFEDEIDKAEQIKQKMQEEAKLANLHQEIKDGVDNVSSALRQSVPVGGKAPTAPDKEKLNSDDIEPNDGQAIPSTQNRNPSDKEI